MLLIPAETGSRSAEIYSRALEEVSHPNLVTLYELVSSDQQCVIAMELIDGDHFLRSIRAGVEFAGHQSLD